jgi:two-component system, cell cycle sensor histidine kinase and response regulator CckA
MSVSLKKRKHRKTNGMTANQQLDSNGRDGQETILVVDDEDSVRKLIEKTLQRHGYQVLSAANGPAAIAMVEGFAGRIDLALVDIMMPEMSGRETYQRIAQQRPGLKVIYMSGYSQLVVASEKLADPEDAFLYKPYTLAGLVSRVQQVLQTSIDI